MIRNRSNRLKWIFIFFILSGCTVPGQGQDTPVSRAIFPSRSPAPVQAVTQQAEVEINRALVVGEVSVSPVTRFGGTSYVFTKDGTGIYTEALSVIDVSSGEESYPIREMEFPGFSSLLRMSPDYRYLSGFFAIKDPKTLDAVYQTYIIDFVEKTSQIVPFDKILSWSPDSSRFLTYSSTKKGLDLVEVRDLSVIAKWPAGPDFRKAEKVSSTSDGDYLWDAAQNIPLASLATRHPAADQASGNEKTEFGLEAIVAGPGTSKIFEPLLSPKETETILASTLDPSGKYVLYALWERSAVPQKDEAFSKYVSDSVLILVDIRTKQRAEFFRLSTFDPENVILDDVYSIQWSQEGKTILVPRKNVGALLIKVENPTQRATPSIWPLDDQ